ncbi:hypothetical protein [Romboutsia lituseburensis]|uniref:hypothetical protein n=1 Tax=Romboutsia lituseburensis TaxID=1537 RepID=UPI0022EAF670|nr:hypothetical protein [Romboutsia lituseburensis]
MEDTLNNSRLLSMVIIILQISYVLSFLLLIYRDDIYGKFVICTLINTVSLLLSMYNLKIKSNKRLILLFITMFEIVSTVYIYMIPEAGVPALITL